MTKMSDASTYHRRKEAAAKVRLYETLVGGGASPVEAVELAGWATLDGARRALQQASSPAATDLAKARQALREARKADPRRPKPRHERPAHCEDCGRPLRDHRDPAAPGVPYGAHGRCQVCYHRKNRADLMRLKLEPGHIPPRKVTPELIAHWRASLDSYIATRRARGVPWYGNVSRRDRLLVVAEERARPGTHRHPDAWPAAA